MSHLPRGFNDREELARAAAARKLDQAAVSGETVEMSAEEALEAAKLVGLPPELIDEFFKPKEITDGE